MAAPLTGITIIELAGIGLGPFYINMRAERGGAIQPMRAPQFALKARLANDAHALADLRGTGAVCA
jgi:crotonobetainyl-CoA:carnitine CoA-transferase CaiB-like acyl-CoA transferase